MTCEDGGESLLSYYNALGPGTHPDLSSYSPGVSSSAFRFTC